MARISRRKRLPHCLMCSWRTTSLLWGLQKKDLSNQGRLRSTEPTSPVPHIMTSPTKKQQWVTVVGDSLLWRMKAAICQSDLLSRELCCQPWDHIRDVAKRLLSLVQPTDYYPLLFCLLLLLLLLFFHVNTNDTVKSSPRCIKED